MDAVSLSRRFGSRSRCILLICSSASVSFRAGPPDPPCLLSGAAKQEFGRRAPHPTGEKCRADADHKLLQSPGEMLCSYYVLCCLTSISNSDGARVLAIASERTLAKRRCCRRAQLSATCDAPDSRLPACVLGRPHKGCRQDACNPAARRSAARIATVHYAHLKRSSQKRTHSRIVSERNGNAFNPSAERRSPGRPRSPARRSAARNATALRALLKSTLAKRTHSRIVTECNGNAFNPSAERHSPGSSRSPAAVRRNARSPASRPVLVPGRRYSRNRRRSRAGRH